MRILMGVLAVALLAGCGTSPVSSSSATHVPPDRVLSHETKLKEGASLVVTRDTGWTAGGGCYVAVLIDGQVAARIGTGETVTLYVSSSRHIVGMAGDAEGGGLCGMQIGQPVKESATELRPGETQKYRISGDTNGLDIRPTSI